MRTILLTLCLALAAFPATGQTIQDQAGATLDTDALAGALAGADVVILGEVHDHPVHHLNQARLVRALRPAAVVFEMLTPEQATTATAHLAAGGSAAEIGAQVGWEETGWPEWGIYRPIFEALSEGARIEGAGVPRARIRALMETEDLASLAPDPDLGPIMADPLAPAIAVELEAEMVEAHCGHLPAAMAPMMVRAQRLRDATLAAVTRKALSEGGPVVVITGNGHARRDRGIPAYLAPLVPEARVLVLGQVEIEEGETVETGDEPYDYTWSTPPHPRPDPCEGLKPRG